MGHATVRVRSAALLAEAMRTEGLSYRDIADRARCGKSMVGYLATGAKTTCTEMLGRRIAEAVGLRFELLFAPAPSVKRGRPSKHMDAAA